MTSATNVIDQRLILFYKGHISALVLFTVHQQNCVIFPKPLPVLSSILDAPPIYSSKLSFHPAGLIQELSQHFGWDQDFLKIESGFCEYVGTPAGIIKVYLAGFVCLDPPLAVLKHTDCQLKTLPELRNQPPTEIELLRRAYVKLMEG